MKITFSVRGIFFEDDIVEKEVDVIDKYDYVFEKKLFADQVGVDYDRVQDDLDPEEYIDIFGVTFFGDRED